MFCVETASYWVNPGRAVLGQGRKTNGNLREVAVYQSRSSGEEPFRY